MHGHGGNAEKHLAYLNDNIRYQLDEAAHAGLSEFLRRAAEAGLIPDTTLQLRGQAEAPRKPQRRSVDALLDYAADGGRLSVQDALWLGEEADTHELGLAADLRRKALHPEE